MFTTSLARDNQAANEVNAEQAVLGNSQITGRAVYEDTGQPATKCRVQLIASELLDHPRARFGIPTAITNENGDFILHRVAAGEYYVIAHPVDQHIANTFPVLGQSGDSSADQARVERFKKDTLRIIVDGRQNLTVNVRVPNLHLGGISGRVLGLSGGPAVRASVHLMSTGERSFGANVFTDEQGDYKFVGLPTGDYIISASPPVQKREEQDQTRGYEGILGATYFPSTLDSNDSPPVTVFADRDTGNIIVKLIFRSLHSLSGTVRMRPDKRPLSNATVRLRRNEIPSQQLAVSIPSGIESAMSSYTSATDKSGKWSIANVPDGSYRVRVESMASESMKQLFVPEELDVTVEGANIENLLVDVSEGSRISGALSIEGNGPSPQFVRLVASRFEGNASSFTRPDEAGEFALSAVPTGEITLSAFPSPQDKFYVKSIEANGLDLLRDNLTIAEGEEIKSVHIVISPNVGVVTGRVLSLKDGKPLAGINLLLKRMNNDKLRLFGGRLATSTDVRGSFMLSAAPGVYVIVAWRAADGPSAFGDALEKSFHNPRLNLKLGPSDRKQLDVYMP